jgi:hypothetical protein
MPDRAILWRARFASDHPLFPVTPWFTLHGMAHTEVKLRTPRSAFYESSPQPLGGVPPGLGIRK